jgi:hypothetical protein
MVMRCRIHVLGLAAGALVAATTVPTAAQAPLSRIVVFGTSLSDSGNAFALRGAAGTPPDYDLNPLLIPTAPYARGGHHFSNGATWVEQCAGSLGLVGTVRPAYGSASPLAANYAVGADAPGRSFVAGQEKPPAAQSDGRNDADAIRQRVKEGQKVRITDDQGREWHGRIEALTPDNLVLLTKDRQRRDIPYAVIVRIDRPLDTLDNGALIGFVSGAAFGMLAVIGEANADCEPAYFSCGDPTAVAYFLVPAVTGAMGTGVGVAIDALIRRDPTLFRRGQSRVTLAPTLARGVRGVSLSVRW